MTPVTDLTAWREDRAARRAHDSRHPVAVGGPNTDILDYIAAELVPHGYRLGLWTTPALRSAHAVRPVTFGTGQALCGIRVYAPRRAEPSVPLCPECFPS